MKTRTSFVALAATVAIAAALPGSVASADEVKLKAASFVPTRIVYGRYFEQWTQRVNKACDGKIEISVVGPEAIASLEQWNALKNGVIDIYFGPANYYKGAAPGADVTLLAENTPQDWRENGAWKIIDDYHREKMNAVYLTTMFDGLPFYLYTRKKAENGSFKNFRLRSVPTYDAFFKSLEAIPVRMAPPDVFTALERGAVDGYGWPLWGVNTFGWDKYTKYRHGPGFFTVSINVLFNLDKWKGLNDEQRACLTDMAKQQEQAWPKFREAQDQREQAAQKKAGIEYVDLGPKFREQAHQMQWKELESLAPDFIQKIKPLLTK